jgi:hypothetical protein
MHTHIKVFWYNKICKVTSCLTEVLKSCLDDAVYCNFKEIVNQEGFRYAIHTSEILILRRMLIAKERSTKLKTVNHNISSYLREGEAGK